MKPYCCNFAVTTAETKQLADFYSRSRSTELYRVTHWMQAVKVGFTDTISDRVALQFSI